MISVLHIEDSRPLAEAVKLICSETCNVDIAETLDEAKQHLRFRSYDILLVDLNLPDSDGLDTISALLPFGIPIVVLTGDPTLSFAEEAARMGAADFIAKSRLPFKELPVRFQFLVRREERAVAKVTKRKSLSFEGFAALKPYLSCAALA